MARLIWWTMILAGVAALLFGASWAAAYASVGNLLGAPPPEMGRQTTIFLWKGMPRTRGHPRAWYFGFGPTLIPGAPSVQVYVSPIGRILRTEPPDLPARLRSFHNTGY
jgi:hypothetical protein